MRFSHVKTSLLAVSMLFGLVEVSSAGICSVADVTLDNMNATSCGWGSTNNDFVTPPPSNWQVNIDDAGNISPEEWTTYNKWDIEGTPNLEGHSLINLANVTPTNGTNPNTTGTFTVNTFDPMLIVLKEGNGAGGGSDYHWYYFEGKSGGIDVAGTWDTTVPFDGRDLSHLTVYTQELPIPAAVWLFGSGLLGLVGLARRRRS